MSKPTIPPGRVLPPKYNFSGESKFDHHFSRMVRLKILLGYDAALHLRVLTRHHVGQFHPLLDLQVTKEKKSCS